jgi:hypothetical protein
MRDLDVIIFSLFLLCLLCWFLFIFPNSHVIPYICNSYEKTIKELSLDDSFQKLIQNDLKENYKFEKLKKNYKETCLNDAEYSKK